MDLGIKGKKAIVCAASKGLGFGSAHALAEAGCQLFICSRNASSLEEAKQKLTAAGAPSVGVASIDLGTSAGAKELLAASRDHFGNADILVNNNGGPPPATADEASSDQWLAGFEQLFMTQQTLIAGLLPSMREQKFGRIINITSMTVIEPIDILSISTGVRAAITANAKSLAREVIADGVTVNCVMPGVIHTDRIDSLRIARAERLGTSFEDEMEKTRAGIPAQRMGRPEELGDLVGFLASSKAGYITGQNICIDGGLTRSW